MAASYLEASLDRLGAPVQRDDTIEICINPDGQVWGEFQGDHFMRGLGTPLTQTEIKDLGNQIASAASTTLSNKKPIVSVSILYRDRPIRAQVIQPPAVEGGFSISLRFFSSLPLEAIRLGFLYGKERSLEGLRRGLHHAAAVEAEQARQEAPPSLLFHQGTPRATGTVTP